MSARIVLGNVFMFLQGDIPQDVTNDIRSTMSYVIPGHRFMAKFKQDKILAQYENREAWDGTKTVTRWTNDGLKMPTGLFSYLKEILVKNEIPYQVIDERAQTYKTIGFTTPELNLFDYQENTVTTGLNRQRGILKASTGCHGAGQNIMLVDGTLRKVEDIKVGDQLMGPDGKPRTVLRLIQGRGEMFKIFPAKGWKPFTINKDHILTLARSNKVVDIPFTKYLGWKRRNRMYNKLFRANIDIKDNNRVDCPFPRKSVQTSFKHESLGEGEFFGFTLDGDGRYVIEDFIVTHNSGKTEMMVSMITRAASFPAMFYVPSCDLLEQAYDRFSKYVMFNGEPAKIGRIGAGHCDIQAINIVTVQSAQLALDGKFSKNKFDDCNFSDKTKFNTEQTKRIREVIMEAQFAYVDECQHTSSDTIQSILDRSHRARYRIGGSASPWRDDGLDILIEAAFGRRFCDITASFLIQKGYLVKPYITFNHFNQALGMTASFASHYDRYVVHNEARNQWIAQKALSHMEKGRPTIILVKHVPHAELLADLIKNNVDILTSSGDSKKSPKKRKEILDKLRNRQIMAVIGTSLLDEGVDVPAASALICAGGGKSSTRELQRIGRVIRLDRMDTSKDAAYVEEFYDHTKYLMHHAKARRRILETEPEFEIMDNRDTCVL